MKVMVKTSQFWGASFSPLLSSYQVIKLLTGKSLFSSSYNNTFSLKILQYTKEGRKELMNE